MGPGFSKDEGWDSSHCFNCNGDGHFQASCPNPFSIITAKKDEDKAMSYPAKKGLNMRICGFGMPGQAFYSIHVPEEGEDNRQKSYPGLLTITGGLQLMEMIDAELKHLFKGKSV
jgi:hypothetical protein